MGELSKNQNVQNILIHGKYTIEYSDKYFSLYDNVRNNYRYDRVNRRLGPSLDRVTCVSRDRITSFLCKVRFGLKSNVKLKPLPKSGPPSEGKMSLIYRFALIELVIEF